MSWDIKIKIEGTYPCKSESRSFFRLHWVSWKHIKRDNANLRYSTNITIVVEIGSATSIETLEKDGAGTPDSISFLDS